MTLSLYLFGKPAWEVNEDDLTGDLFRSLGEELKSRLNSTADYMDKLLGDGWTVELGLYDLIFYKENVKNVEQYLIDLEMDPFFFSIGEEELEDVDQ